MPSFETDRSRASALAVSHAKRLLEAHAAGLDSEVIDQVTVELVIFKARVIERHGPAEWDRFQVLYDEAKIREVARIQRIQRQQAFIRPQVVYVQNRGNSVGWLWVLVIVVLVALII